MTQLRSTARPSTRTITSAQPTRAGQATASLHPAFVEVVLPAGADAPLPTVPGLTLKLWPQARLGDATLELRPDAPLSVPQMLALLAGAGITALGPVRVHH